MNEKTINRKKERKQIRKSSYEDEKSNDIGTVQEKKEKKVIEKALSTFCRLKYIIENGKTLPVKICKCTDIKKKHVFIFKYDGILCFSLSLCQCYERKTRKKERKSQTNERQHCSCKNKQLLPE